ncbi:MULTISPECIES: cell division ATP-binding protein FtsE [Limibacillus]|uniref:Cell division ATP-binding protein FtsE n=1 Tax=Limibacillus halophilus TaxID=1579333 RepID=A0A839ST95_9PROT|nr:cell division ATP-binding protein FtsE [Limibacillus halophilus]MBB3066077.1 cell division transport system ATP-binding protein [Limibacillus halophilus]
MIQFEDVAVRYGRMADVLSDVTFRLEPGSFHYVSGPSGAGKSSLLKLMYLAMPPTRGRISLFGRDVESLDRNERALLRRMVGVVFQEFRLLNHLTVFENVALPMKISGERPSRRQAHVKELLEWVGLGSHLHAAPLTLSGGQQQRVAIARAVITRPKLLIADEPTGNMDDRMAVRLMYLFEELNRIGTTVVIATHNDRLIERFAHPVIHLNEGRLSILEPGEQVLA